MWKWYVFQGLVMFAVIASNIHWQWTPNGLLAGIIGYGVAFVATWITGKVASLFLWFRRRSAERLVGLQDDPSSRSPGLTRLSGEISQPLQQWPRPRISKDMC